jgi:hypothetical protein
MKEQNDKIKAELINQIQRTKEPIIKRVLEKRLKEIEKEVKK